MTTLGKTVTLPKGVVVTDIGPGIVNGEPSESVRQMQERDGYVHLVLDCVVEALPETISRASFAYRPA